MWNKFEFIEKTENLINDAIKTGEIFDHESFYPFLDSIIENECIYYNDCFDIIKELQYTDWQDNEFGINVTDITTLAVIALTEFVTAEISVENFIDIDGVTYH
jgi:hypothetical protein